MSTAYTYTPAPKPPPPRSHDKPNTENTVPAPQIEFGARGPAENGSAPDQPALLTPKWDGARAASQEWRPQDACPEAWGLKTELRSGREIGPAEACQWYADTYLHTDILLGIKVLH